MLRSVGSARIWRLHASAVWSLPDAPAQPEASRAARSQADCGRQHDSRVNAIMGKGNKQRGNREAKKPKADKKVAPVSATFLGPQTDARKPGGKPPSK
jgi:hypothetical protein